MRKTFVPITSKNSASVQVLAAFSSPTEKQIFVGTLLHIDNKATLVFVHCFQKLFTTLTLPPCKKKLFPKDSLWLILLSCLSLGPTICILYEAGILMYFVALLPFSDEVLPLDSYCGVFSDGRIKRWWFIHRLCFWWCVYESDFWNFAEIKILYENGLIFAKFRAISYIFVLLSLRHFVEFGSTVAK